MSSQKRADKKPYRPWRPIEVIASDQMPLTDLQLRKSDVVALKMFREGTADKGQQERAWAAIMWMCGLNDQTFLPEEHGGERDSTFKGGKRHIALELNKLTTLSLTLLTGEKDDGSNAGNERRSGRPGDHRNSDRARSGNR